MRPAPIPQPRPEPPASAWVVVEARLPVTASVARARAAILVLIDMRNSIRLSAARFGPHAPVGRSVFESGSIRVPEIASFSYSFAITDSYTNGVSASGRPKAFPDRICRYRRAIRRTRARRDRAGVGLSPRMPGWHRRRRRSSEGPGPATLTVPAGALRASDNPL